MIQITITNKQIKKETFFWLLCLVLAFAVNTGAIIFYKTKWSELITTFHITLGLSLIFYILFSIIRLFAGFVKRKVQRSKA